MNRRLFIYSGVAVAAIAAGGYMYHARTSVNEGALSSADPGVILRALTLPDLEGTPQSMAQWDGRPLVVNFWATWCAPCVKEMPELQMLQEKYPTIQFVGIGVDKVENMRQFLQKVPVSYPLLVLGGNAVDMLRQLGNPTGGLPFTLLFNADGTLSRKILGQIQVDDLDRSLKGL